MTHMDELLAYQRVTEALASVAGRTGWDQETVMPRGATAQRGEEMAALESVLHARRTSPEFLDLLGQAEARTEAETAMLRVMRRDAARNTKVPAELAARIARVTSESQAKWAEARANDDFASFAPVLAEVLDLRRQEGAAIADGGDPYDALLQDYEPGTTSAEISALFDEMRPGLVALRSAVLEQPAAPELQGTFSEEQQLAVAHELAVAFGYDMDHGRIDKAVHPFSSGSGQDVRITTRVDENDPFNCLYSTVHEVGHACYEQNIQDAFMFTPLGGGVSMGVHESQSRSYENQMARSKPFCHWLHGRMVERFGDMGLDGPDAFCAAVNRVAPGFIRTEADELSYNLHVMLRFDLEQQMIRGDLDVADLEDAWNARFASDFGVEVPKASLGVLQDVHWPVGLMGYFPTYALGNVYAGCLFAALRRDVPDLDDQMARGDVSAATGWMQKNLQVHGGLYEPRDVVARASGDDITAAPLLSYLQDKYGALYGV